MEKTNNFEQEAAVKKETASEVKIAGTKELQEQEAEENKYVIEFKKSFVWEDETYTKIDLSGVEDLSAKDMIQAQRVMEKSGSINVLPEMSLEYACIFAAKATKMPVEFFQALPPKEAIKVKNKITNFFYGEE